MSTSAAMIWLAADYHLPALYAYRIPMSSSTHAPTLPTPGPATVRLALLRRSIELFGVERTREELFPVVRAMAVHIRPPRTVAISVHRERTHKWERDREQKRPRVQESLLLRELAHAQGPLTLYLQIPAEEEARLRVVLEAIGYWGSTDALASCLAIHHTAPLMGECVLPLQQVGFDGPLQPFFSGLATEFRQAHLSWEEVTTSTPMNRGRKVPPPLLLDVYVWPLVLRRQHDGNKLFERQSLRAALVPETHAAPLANQILPEKPLSEAGKRREVQARRKHERLSPGRGTMHPTDHAEHRKG